MGEGAETHTGRNVRETENETEWERGKDREGKRDERERERGNGEGKRKEIEGSRLGREAGSKQTERWTETETEATLPHVSLPTAM